MAVLDGDLGPGLERGIEASEMEAGGVIAGAMAGGVGAGPGAAAGAVGGAAAGAVGYGATRWW